MRSPNHHRTVAVPSGSTTAVAVAGNPNAGKTAIFNALTGVRQRTGNWPGVTVDRKEGRYDVDGRRFSLVDLPGTYSLDTTSPDQRIARDHLLNGDVDAVVHVLDASNLERHLYLAVQVAEIGVPMVLALNMMDVARRDGLLLDVDALSRAFGCEVVPVVAVTGEGIDALVAAVDRAATSGVAPRRVVRYDPVIERAIDRVATASGIDADGTSSVERRWWATRALERDGDALRRVGPDGAAAATRIADELASALGADVDVVLADRRYGTAHDIATAVVARPNPTVGSISDRVDRLVIHRVWGVPIFLAVMYVMFMFTINVGGAFVDAFDGLAGALFVDGFGELLTAAGAPAWLTVVLADGIGGGVQVVATFVPIIAALYLFLSVLEDSGYMARAAFVMDRTMRRIGLPGKAFVPMIVGFGCNVPAVMATRTLDDQRQRKLTILMNPFMSCGARLPVYALFAAAFFPDSGQNLVFVLYLAGIAVAIATGLVMKHSLLPGRSAGFLMELPAYHRPTLRNIALHTWDRLRVFVRNAGGVIVVMVTVLAVLSSVGTDGSLGNEDDERSVLAGIGRTITPVFEPMGLDDENWPATVGIFTGVLAKEAVVGTLDSLYGSLADTDAGVTDDEEPFDLGAAVVDSLASVPENLADVAGTVTDPLGLRVGDVGTLESAADELGVDEGVYGAMERRFDGRAGAFAYLLFVLLYFPCVAVIGAIVREAGRPWALFVAAWTTGAAYVVATSAYQLARFPEHPASSTAWLLAAVVAVVAAFAGLRRWAARSRPSGGSRPGDDPAPVPVSIRRRA